jgi:hypothetical protein
VTSTHAWCVHACIDAGLIALDKAGTKVAEAAQQGRYGSMSEFAADAADMEQAAIREFLTRVAGACAAMQDDTS